MNGPEPYVFIEASAGTGKTQSLGERLIALLRGGVKPQEIVALTFSRAAAGEIFERFVMLLAGYAAKDPADAERLRQVIGTQHLSQIGTLDSFLMRILRVFPLELGLQGELEMMDDYEAASARNAVAFSILRRTDAQTRHAFADAFALAMNREDVRSFVAAYQQFIRTWHERTLAAPEAAAWGDPARIWGRTPAFASVGVRELASAADALEGDFDTADWTDFVAWVRAFRGKLGGLKGIAKKLVESDVFAGDVISFTFKRRAYALSREQTVRLRTALTCVFGYVVRQRLELARGIHTLMATFERAYDERVRRTGRLVFADVPRLIASLPESTRLALEFRMDSRIRAWALDEFQDTSREQWRALENLLDEAKQSDGGTSVFVVGDRKQAIYGWRNGDVGIFEREKAGGFYRVTELQETYRSGPAVVAAVNRVFARGRIFDEYPAWRCPEHLAHHKDLAGFVRVEAAPGRTQDDFLEPVFVALSAALGAQADDPRRRGVTAAVLVRGNAFGAFLADGLKRRGFEGVAWEGESAVFDTPALAGFLDLLRLADHPGDRVAYRHFKMTALARAKYPGGVPSAAELSREMALACTTRGLVRALRELRAVLPDDPGAAWSRFTEERFTDMLRAASEFELGRRPGTRLADFPDFLAAKKKRNVAEEGKVKIMTIHHAKGLGFDYVVLPLYEPKGLSRDPDGPLVGDGWVLPDPGASVARALGGLEAAYAERRDRAEQEALCTYYVAMTRAKSAMTVICQPPPAKADGAMRFSDLVRSAELGDLANPDAVVAGSRRAAEMTRAPAPLPAPVRHPRSAIRRRLPTETFADGISAGTLFASDDARREALARGSARHAAMERVEFTAELPKPAGFVTLWRERAFEVFADGEWISGRFDRVTFFRGPGGLCAEIVDFKLSLRHPERYDGQLAAYRRAVAALTGIPLERISARLMELPRMPESHA